MIRLVAAATPLSFGKLCGCSAAAVRAGGRWRFLGEMALDMASGQSGFLGKGCRRAAARNADISRNRIVL
jgi:hypothetical protein